MAGNVVEVVSDENLMLRLFSLEPRTVQKLTGISTPFNVIMILFCGVW